MSSCILCLNSSGHAAPGFWLSLLWGRGDCVVLISSGGFRAATLNLRVGREDVRGLESLIREVDGSLIRRVWYSDRLQIVLHSRSGCLFDEIQKPVEPIELSARDGCAGSTSIGRRDLARTARMTRSFYGAFTETVGGTTGPGLIRYLSTSSIRRASCRASRAISSIVTSTLMSSLDSSCLDILFPIGHLRAELFVDRLVLFKGITFDTVAGGLRCGEFLKTRNVLIIRRRRLTLLRLVGGPLAIWLS